MKIFSSNNPLMTIVLVFLTIVLAIIVVPFLIIVAICCLFSHIVIGLSGGKNKAPRQGSAGERPSQVPPRDGASDDALECEVISARTVSEESGDGSR